jgi:hypothetical protein
MAALEPERRLLAARIAGLYGDSREGLGRD